MEAELRVEAGPTRQSLTLLPDQTVYLGSASGSQLGLQLQLADAALGPQHAAVKLDAEGNLRVVDLGFPGGTRLNDTHLSPGTPTEAFGGDALALGDHVVRLTLLGARGRRGRTRRQASSAPSALLADRVIPTDEFELLSQLGSGAAGTVYAARWIPHDRVVALKVLHPDTAPGSPAHERFVREATVVARLQSPFVVAIHDLRVDPSRSRAYAVLEWVAGRSTRAHFNATGPLPIAHALRIGEDVAQALAAAAEEGIVHRDVKPDNILLSTHDQRAKLCDFGIAKDLDSTLRSLTTSGLGLGTMAYLPPEQISEAKHVEPSADVYALGATLYHLIAGQPPFAPTSAKALVDIARQAPPLLTHHRPDCPAQVEQAVHAMLEKDPDARPPVWRLARQLASLRQALYPGAELASLFSG